MKKEYMYAGTSVLCFGTVATASKLLMNQLDAVYVLAFSFLAATLFLGIYNWKKGYLHELRELSRKTVIRMVVIGSLGVFFYNYFLVIYYVLFFFGSCYGLCQFFGLRVQFVCGLLSVFGS